MKKAAIYIVEALMQRLYTVSSTVFDSAGEPVYAEGRRNN
jgi:hypothetical protein